MTDLDLIKRLEQHAGFVLNRLTCDGNIYAGVITLTTAYDSQAMLRDAFTVLRNSLTNIELSDKSKIDVIENMNKFDVDEWQD